MSLKEYSIGEFKARFSEMIQLVEQGDSIVVTYGREKRPIALFGPPPAPPKRQLGKFAGKLKVDFSPQWKMTEEEFLNG